jgi:hypothetical protein
MSTDVNTLNWSDRFAIIDKFTPADEVICHTMNVTQDELDTARDLRSHGNFKAKPDINVNDYKSLMVDTVVAKPKKTKPATTHTKPTKKKTATTPPSTATKPVKVPKKRGRKGSKIADAFMAVPATAVSAADFIAEHGVSLAVLRQSRRFDKSGLDGAVRVKQDKETKTLMVWREATVS